MSARRPRISRSSSLGGKVGMCDYIPTIDTPAPLWERIKRRPALVSAEPVEWKPVCNTKPTTIAKSNGDCRPVFTIGSPTRESNGDEDKPEIKIDEGFGVFFQACALCKKKIDKHVYMYGYLTAYCSEECQLSQIIKDNGGKNPFLESNEEADNSVQKDAEAVEVASRGFSAQATKKYAIPRFK